MLREGCANAETMSETSQSGSGSLVVRLTGGLPKLHESGGDSLDSSLTSVVDTGCLHIICMLRNSFPRTRNCVSVSLVSLSTLFLFSVSLDSPSLASIDNSKEADCGANQRKQSIAFTFFSWRLLSDSLTRKLRLLLRNLQSCKGKLACFHTYCCCCCCSSSFS